MKNTIITIIIVIIVFGIGAVYVLRQPSATGNTTGQTQTPVTNSADQTPPATPTPVTQNKPSSMDTQNTKAETAVFHTSMGNFSITLSPETAPKTVANFVKLAQSGFYNGVKFHRVIKDFMIQGGDPNSKDDSKKSIWGQGGPGYKFADELTGKETYSQGTFAMANAGPNTNGSQFFIMTGVNVPLPPSYTVFGHVSSGMDVPLAIEKVPTAPGDQPITDVVINSITIQ